MNSRAAMRRTADSPALVIVFAKAPVPGRVKTRLVPVLGEAGAARLQAQLILRALETALAAGCGDVELCCAPHRRHAFFDRCARIPGVRLTAQGGGDIGFRMHRALARGLATHAAAILVGSDVPSLRARDLRAAARALRGGTDAVFSPAEDGGYALIGATRVSKRLFQHVEWGTASVMSDTRRQMRMFGWQWKELRRVWDVDRPEDHARLLRSQLLGRAP